MKFTMHKLRVGDIVRAEVTEALGAHVAGGIGRLDDLIVSFQGDLVRVRNESHRRWRVGEKILVRVTQVSPLLFQLVNEDHEKRSATRINVQV